LRDLNADPRIVAGPKPAYAHYPISFLDFQGSCRGQSVVIGKKVGNRGC
jgi:hypothetical protein